MTGPSTWLAPRASRPSPRALALLTVVLLAVVVAVTGFLVKMPYVIFSPGPAQDTLGAQDGKQVIEVSGTRTYPTSGTLDFTTVSVYGGPRYPVSFWKYLEARLLDDDSVIAPEETVYPKGTTSEQIAAESSAQMTDSQKSAEVVAVRAAGGKVTATTAIADVRKDGPAGTAGLRKGDVLRSVNGRPVTTVESVAAAMKPVTPGQAVTIVASRGSKRLTVRPVTTKGQDGRALVGILLEPRFAFPYTVRINAGDVGGPSAGLMFSLAIYDKLTPGALTAGKDFAGTGEMSVNGKVGPIGGIRQKMVGARETGAEYFLAPADNCNEVTGHVPEGMTVIKVATFDEARTAVKQVAAGRTTGLPSCG